MKTPRGRILRWSAVFIALLLIGGAVGAGWFYRQMQHSLPQLNGTAKVEGLARPVTITRDALGVPTLHGAERTDLARALGWLHAQDRFFQMDLLRRSAAGELAELFGAKAVPADKAVRIHGLRRTAREDLALLEPTEKKLLEAYTAGVNAGLQALGQKPFEYIALRTEPRPWQPEDSMLVALAMALQLNDLGRYERSLTALRDTYGMEAVEFFAPLMTANDAALDGSTGRPAPIPSSTVIDLRRMNAVAQSARAQAEIDAPRVGSNSFALSGAHTANGVPVLANDMHLPLRVPNTWYRVSLVWPAEPPANTPENQVTGVTLPGLPLIIAGSNGHVAWGLTNSYADSGDVVVIEPNVISRQLYKSGDQLVPFEVRHEVIKVRGGDPVNLDVSWTKWGPVIGAGEKTRPLAFHWTAHQPGAINLSLIGMEAARHVADALAVAHRAGMPAQNLLVVDRQGRMAWTIAGPLPKRVGYDGRFPVAWTYGDRYWEGMVPAAEIPVVADPADGRLWTANNRIIGGPGLNVLGDGGYDRPVRAACIRDHLQRLEKATPADLLAVQLDDHAPMLDRWHALLLQTLSPEATAAKASRAKLRRAVETWDAHARIDSVSYRLVRAFRQLTANLVYEPIMAPCAGQYAGFSWHQFHYEQPLWTLLTARPGHLLNPAHNSWDELLLAAADGVMASLDEQGLAVDQATWGRRNRARIEHPLERILPGWLGAWLNMPGDPLPGDSLAPRVQSPDFGASERFVVAPGHEAEGIFEMPGGQSGHPLSPYYRAGHEAWVQGRPAPFLPGPAGHTLTLSP